jgi:hypothetical protein
MASKDLAANFLDLTVFDTQTDMTDVVFEVEDHKLYFSKALLAVSSPVFRRMFSSGFKEARYTTQPIPLPGKRWQEFVLFLKQCHPSHSWLPIISKYIHV